MKRILVAGFGNMGCRHVQSLLSGTEQYELFVLEPSADNIRNNCDRIGANPQSINWCSTLDEVPGNIDLAVVATSAAPRYTIVRRLIEKGVKLFLLEKIVFQSAQQFNIIIDLMRSAGVIIYCNFVNRYFEAYNRLRNELSSSRGTIKMVVYGGEFGLGCNAIHYIDLFGYITGTDGDITIKTNLLQLSETGNKRGNEYNEFFGAITCENGRKDELLIHADKGFQGGITININWNDNTYLFSEQTQKVLIQRPGQLHLEDFTILPTSKLTGGIVQEIFAGDCRLTRLEATKPVHEALFREFNTILFGFTNDEIICPIT